MADLQTVDRFVSIFLMEANAWSAALNTKNTKTKDNTRGLNIPAYHFSSTGFKFHMKKMHGHNSNPILKKTVRIIVIKMWFVFRIAQGIPTGTREVIWFR